MKGLLHIVCTVLLVLQTGTPGVCANSTIPEKNYIKEKCYFKQARCKAVSSFVKKVKKIKHIDSFSSSDFEHLEGDDLGGDNTLEDTQEDSLNESDTAFSFFYQDLSAYSFLGRRYNSFVRFHIPPPKQA